jgi:uncharacterized membrane protein
MNKMLVAVFDDEASADAGVHALRKLHTEGDLTLYASGVIAKDAAGKLSVKEASSPGPVGAGVGLAVGSLIGLLAGPVGLVVGAMTGTVAGAIRDFWVAGVGLDFVEEAERHLLPGKVAVVAEIEEEWVTPADSALQALGGVVFRRQRSDVIEAQFDHDMVAFKAEINELESEADHASGSVKATLQAKIAATKGQLDETAERAKQRIETLKQEALAKTESLHEQLNQATGDAKGKIEDRVKRVKSAYSTRGAKLSQAWSLTKEALAI